MKLGIMQPYFLPYIGYWQLLNAVDKYIVYDNIEYSKGWINRNRFLQNGKAAFFTIPLAKGSDYLDIRDRKVSQTFDKPKMLRRFTNAYCKAPNYKKVFPLLEKIINYQTDNLFVFVFKSIIEICEYLGIDHSKIIISSTIPIDHTLKSEEKVLAFTKALNASEYLNAIGGVDLYNKTRFLDQRIQLSFLETIPIQYKQFNHKFVPSLSIIDVMMFNSVERIREMLKEYELK